MESFCCSFVLARLTSILTLDSTLTPRSLKTLEIFLGHTGAAYTTLPGGGRGGTWHRLDPRGRSQTHSLEGFVGLAHQLGPGEVGLAVEFHRHGMELGEVAQHILVARLGVLLAELAQQEALQDQGQEADHDVPPDPPLRPVEHGPQVQGGLEGAEGALDPPEVLVGPHHGLRLEVGVGAEQILPVVASRPLDGLGIQGQSALRQRLEVAGHEAVAEQLLGFPALDPLLEAVEHGLASLAVVLRLEGVVAEDVALALVDHLLDAELLVDHAVAPWLAQHGLGLAVAPQGHADDVLHAGFLDGAQQPAAHHAPVRHEDHPAQVETPLERVKDGLHRGLVGSIAREDLVGDGTAVPGHEHAHHQLGPVRAFVAGIAVGRQALGPPAFEVAGCTVPHDHVDLGPEQVTGPGEKTILDRLLVLGQHIQGAVVVMQLQLLGLRPVDALQPLPHQTTLGAGVGEAVEHNGENGLGHVEGELAILQQGRKGLVQLGLLPQALKDQSGPPLLGPANVETFRLFFEPAPGAAGEAGQVLDEGIEAAVLEILQPAHGGDHPLTDAAALADAFDELEVGAGEPSLFLKVFWRMNMAQPS